MSARQALVITRTRDGLLASCACGFVHGESVTWESSVELQRQHNEEEHGDA